MTDADYEFIEDLYNKAKNLKELMNESEGDEFVHLRIAFDELDAVEELVNNTSHKTLILDDKITNIRSYVLLKSNGMVELNKETIIGIIEKAVL